MTAQVSDSRRKHYANLLAQKNQELAVIEFQSEETQSNIGELKLNKQAERLLKEIEELEAKIQKLDLTENEDNNRCYIALKDKLPKIDFKEQIKIVKNILEEFTEYGAACFLIDDALNMAGDLFSLEVKKILNEETTDLKYYPVAFSNGSRLDEIGFLQSLGDYLDVSIENKEEYLKIIDKFFGFIENGSIIFVEIKKIDLLNDKESFLSWLVENFWKGLTDKLPLACQLRDVEQVRFILLIVDDDIFEECSFCEISMINLKDWTEKHIKNWLTKHSGLPKNQIAQMAKSIYRRSRGGTPKLICEALKNKLT